MRKSSVSIIFGADGPTSVFIAGKSKPKTLGNQIRSSLYKHRYRRAEKKIRANPHTLQQLIAYAGQKYHAAEILPTERKYLRQYACAKENLIAAHKPELLDGLPEITPPDILNRKTSQELSRQLHVRSEMIAKIPDHEMPMDFHIYELRTAHGRAEMKIDFIWGLLELSYSGKPKALKKLTRELYLYYGVTEEDIRDKTQRYLSLISVLST